MNTIILSKEALFIALSQLFYLAKRLQFYFSAPSCQNAKTWHHGLLFIRRKWTPNNRYVHVTSTLPASMRHVARQWSWPKNFYLELSQSSVSWKSVRCPAIECLLCSDNHLFSYIPLLKMFRCLREGMRSLRLFRARLSTTTPWQVCNIAIIKL